MITLAKSAGFCFGVRAAVNLAEQAAEASQTDVYTLGPIIHNKHVIAHLEQMGVHAIDFAKDVPANSTVIIRSHGAPKSEIELLEQKKCKIMDATCPDVKKIHRILMEEEGKGRQVLIFGKPKHPEIIAAAGWCTSPVILPDSKALEQWITAENNSEKNISIVFQTTELRENLEKSEKILKKWCTSAKIFDTICSATSKRQEEARILAENCDVMVVIGDKSSANSRNLAEICKNYCDCVLFIEDITEFATKQLQSARTHGMIAGASTPDWIIKEVFGKMSEEMLGKEEMEAVLPQETVVEEAPAEAVAETAPDEESFDALLEQNFRTLHTGEKVKGIVTTISPTEIGVDLGIKQAAYIPVTELTEEPDLNVEDIVQIGAEVEAYVMRVNDVEGMVMLSKKRLDTVKYWTQIEAAVTDKTIFEGKVTGENKGGVEVRVRGIRVFVPASQTGIPKDQPLTPLLGQTVRLRIMEVNQARRRVVGSIRIVGSEEKREQAMKVWAEIEPGKRYDGTVKSLTSYGAFVDIGGVDGMVHVSELSWKRVSSPADVLKIGDSLDVYVISCDKEKGKISLGHKDPNANPWKVFTDKYEEGSLAKVKIVKLMPFGAFAEVVPGVDGLIHISQIADHRIGRPDELLSIGQEVDVKVIGIDMEKKNVSLSIRALLETAKGAPEDGFASEAAEEESDAIVYDTDINKPEEIEETVETPVEAEAVVEETPAEVEAAPEEAVVEEAPAQEE